MHSVSSRLACIFLTSVLQSNRFSGKGPPELHRKLPQLHRKLQYTLRKIAQSVSGAALRGFLGCRYQRARMCVASRTCFSSSGSSAQLLCIPAFMLLADSASLGLQGQKLDDQDLKLSQEHVMKPREQNQVYAPLHLVCVVPAVSSLLLGGCVGTWPCVRAMLQLALLSGFSNSRFDTSLSMWLWQPSFGNQAYRMPCLAMYIFQALHRALSSTLSGLCICSMQAYHVDVILGCHSGVIARR